jgi:hypothetical protein
MRSMPRLYKKQWTLSRRFMRDSSVSRKTSFKTVEDFIVSGECYNCLCVIVTAILKL